jgi:hypothetical protein
MAGLSRVMKYMSGEEVHVGDKVIADKSEGVVVCVIGSDRTQENCDGRWAHLKAGMLVDTADMGLVHYPAADDDVRLVERRLKSEKG